MTRIPLDLTDLQLAPVVLDLDARLEQLGRLDPAALALQVVLESNASDRTVADRRYALLVALAHDVDLRGWATSVDPRGLRVQHGRHTVVLGLPPSLVAYLAGPVAAVPA